MRKLVFYLLMMATLLCDYGDVFAQGMGLGMGMSDMPVVSGKAGPPAVIGDLLLVGGGNILLVGGGNLQCVGSC